MQNLAMEIFSVTSEFDLILDSNESQLDGKWSEGAEIVYS